MQIMTLNGVDCYEQNGTAYLKLENVARGLGFTREQNGVEYIRWERVQGYLKDLGFSPQVGKDDFIPENIFYRLAMKAKNETAEKFQALVADEIIPSIRRTGSYSVSGQSNPRLEMELMILRSIGSDLHMSEASKLLMYEKLAKDKGLSTSFIPDYGRSGNHVSFSATELLKRNGCSLTTVKFNQRMLDAGYLTEKERPSSKGTKKFKALTEKGLRYGENVVSPHNTRETQPLYFEDSFMELYGKL